MKFRFLIIFLLVIILLAAAPAAKAVWLIDRLGQLSEIGQKGQVLGEGSRLRQGSGGQGGKEESEVRPDENKAEMRFGDENRIKMESKPGEVKTEIRQGENRIRLERKDGEIKMKIRDEATGEERELEIRKETEEEKETETEQELLRIREREDRNEIKVGSDSGRFVIKRNRVGAVSEFPLSIDLSTNTLSVTTPAGEKQVTVLPDQAVANMLARNVIDRIAGQEAGDLTTRVKMSQETDGTLTYEVEGEKQERLLGLMPLKFKKTAVVSAETGELVTTRETITDRLLDLISF